MEEKSIGWLHGSGQRLNAQMEIGDKGCPSGVRLGTSTV